MSAHRILIYGNSGSGKTTLAREMARSLGAIPHVDLDTIAWESPRVRKPLAASVALLDGILAANPQWIIEGCYGDLIAAALPHATTLRFLNPGVEACVANCRRRRWEPSKFDSPEEQDAMLEALIDWVRQYETRKDEYGLARHRAVFESFTGEKSEIRAP